MSEQRRLAASTAVFGAATAVSRVAGVIREIVAASFFGASPALGAFLIAFNVPNLVRSLVADSAISAAFVPVFMQLREEGREPEAWRVASIVLWLAAVILGALSSLFILLAPWIMPIFVPGNENIDPNLVVELSRWMFPIVAILGMTGVVTGILNSYEIFGVPAMAPIAWNAVIILALVLSPHSAQAYAIGVLVATIVQFVIPLPLLRGRGQSLVFSLAWRNPHVIRVLKLMVPVTIGLGLINFNLTLDLSIATLVPGGHADAYLNYAFRMFMLPQGLFSVAVSQVLFPEISRLAARRDISGFARTVGAMRDRVPGGHPSAGRGVKVEVGEKQTAIDLQVVVAYGVSITDLAAEVRENVIAAVERMTGLEVVEVNIAVNDVHLPDEDTQETPEDRVH